MFMSATTTPRMRVDNCIQFFGYDGSKFGKLEFPQLFAAAWRPVLAETPEQAASPRALAQASDGPVKPPVKAAYRPPGAQEAGDDKFAAVVRGDLAVDQLPEDKRREILGGRGRNAAKAAQAPKPSKWDDVTHVARAPPKVQETERSCPETDWFYRDPEGLVHGPYTKKMMQAWSSGGYFSPDLELKVGKDRTFAKLKDLFPSDKAFDSQINWPWKD